MKIYDSNGNSVTPCDDSGKEICVMDAIKAQLEWHEEYGRAEFFRKIAITETIIFLISILSAYLGIILRKEE